MIAVILGQIERLPDTPRAFPVGLLVWSLSILAVAIVLSIVWNLIRRRRREQAINEPDLDIDVASLGEGGPAPGELQLEFYNLPMRLAGIVLAPVGRRRRLPPPDEMQAVIDSIVPGLAEVARAHRPVLYYWPTQLSPRGFAHSFFSHARLPGDAGKGTPWCSAAGVFRVDDQPVMAGLIMSAKSNNRFGQVIVELETKWLDLLRIRRQQ